VSRSRTVGKIALHEMAASCTDISCVTILKRDDERAASCANFLIGVSKSLMFPKLISDGGLAVKYYNRVCGISIISNLFCVGRPRREGSTKYCWVRWQEVFGAAVNLSWRRLNVFRVDRIGSKSTESYPVPL